MREIGAESFGSTQPTDSGGGVTEAHRSTGGLACGASCVSSVDGFLNIL